MVKFENSIHIKRPVEEVFSFLADFENIPRWNYYVLEVKKLSPGSAGLGSLYHQVRKTDEQDFRISEYELNHRVAVKTEPGNSPMLEMRFILQPDGEGTTLKDQWELETGRPTILEKLSVGRVKAAVAENLGKLKELLEEGHAHLQDGRVTRKDT